MNTTAKILDKIDTPKDLKSLNAQELNLLADEMFSEHTNQVEFSRSTVTANNLWVQGVYKSLYETIYLSNLILQRCTAPPCSVGLQKSCRAGPSSYRAT